MHIVIMGCGRVGTALSTSLTHLEHTVAVIDMDPLAFRRLGENPEARGIRPIQGVGFDRDTLIEAGIERAGAFAAVSNGDNSNIIAARVARETFGVSRVIARIYDAKRAEVYERLGIPTVATVPWTASRLMKGLLGETTSEVWRDPTGAVALLHVAPDEAWVGRSVSEFEAATGGRVAIVTRFGSGQVPGEDTIVQSGDALHLLAAVSVVPAVKEAASRPPEVVSS